MSRLDLNFQKYLISQKFWPVSKHVFHVLKHTKPYLRHFNCYTNLQRVTQATTPFEAKPSNIYNVTSKSFYESQEKWYSKSLYIVGQNVSEFAVDLKPLESLACSQSTMSEFIKIELKKKTNVKLGLQKNIH